MLLRSHAAAASLPRSARRAAGAAPRLRSPPPAAGFFSSFLPGQRQETPAAPMNDRWWTSDDVAVVTGANKGIGFDIARLLAEAGMRVIVAARDPALGAAAVSKLRALPSVPDPSLLDYARLDLTDKASIQALATDLGSRGVALTALVNNAGFAFKGTVFGADEAATTIGVNFRGTADVCQALVPLLAANRGRVVNVSSGSGSLARIPSAAVRARLEGAKSRADLEQLADDFVGAIRAGTNEKEGWGSSMYGFSKALETAYTRVLARELEGSGIAVNACCPGWCSTAMSSFSGTRSAAQGADTPAWLATLPQPADGAPLVTGLFWRDRQQQKF